MFALTTNNNFMCEVVVEAPELGAVVSFLAAHAPASLHVLGLLLEGCGHTIHIDSLSDCKGVMVTQSRDERTVEFTLFATTADAASQLIRAAVGPFAACGKAIMFSGFIREWKYQLDAATEALGLKHAWTEPCMLYAYTATSSSSATAASDTLFDAVSDTKPSCDCEARAISAAQAAMVNSAWTYGTPESLPKVQKMLQ